MSNLAEQLNYMSSVLEEDRVSYETSAIAWWDSLSKEDRERAFYVVVAKIVDAEIKQKASYRYVLYDIFGFDASMYSRGMDCGFMTLHNSIVDAESLSVAEQKIAKLEKYLLKYISKEDLKEIYDD